MRGPRLAWSALALTAILDLVGLVFDVASGGDVFEFFAILVLGGPFAVGGALIAARQPAQPIGWLMLGVGVALALASACDGLVQMLLEHPGGVSPGWPALVSALAFRAFFLLTIATLLIVPTGTLPSRRWRAAAGAVWLLAGVSVLLVVVPGPFADWKEEDVRNPIGIEALEGPLRALDGIATALTMLLLLTAIVSVALRFRGARGVERAQLRWIAAAVGATLTLWLLMIAGSLVLPEGRAVDSLWAVALLSLAFVPIGICIAVVRYRLFEIDRLISRALAYAALTVVLAAAYIGLVLVGQWVFSSFAGGSNLAIATSTLIVAALFLPLRSRVQNVVDRRFNRRRFDAQRTLETFGARLRDEVDLGELAAELRAVVAETMQPRSVTLWRRVAP